MNIIYSFSIVLILSFAVVVFILLFFVTAPYGKFLRKGRGPSISSKWAWMIMESPSPAVMTWSLPGLAFFIFSFANLFPRGVSSHKWYKEKFPDYPPERKAVIPFIV